MKLLALATDARQHAYCPYSHYAVGAAALLRDGTVTTGCNVENISYGLTICAERSAVFAAVRNSAKPQIVSIAVVGGPIELATVAHAEITPCGACLQVLSEFAAGDCTVICASPDYLDSPRTYTLGKLLPHAFGNS